MRGPRSWSINWLMLSLKGGFDAFSAPFLLRTAALMLLPSGLLGGRVLHARSTTMPKPVNQITTFKLCTR